MIATISQIKKVEFLSRSNEEGIEKISYTAHGTESAWENHVIGETLLDLTLDQLKHEGLVVSDEHADFDVWPCSNWKTDEHYALIVISVATTDEGRKTMIEALDIC